MARRRGTKDAASGGPSLAARGGTYRPIDQSAVHAIADAALEILTDIGLSEGPETVANAITPRGGQLRDGRLLYGRALIEEMLANAPGTVRLCGQVPAHDLDVGGAKGFVGTGGAAPSVLDMDSGAYRPSTLGDLYAAARLTDALAHIQFFSRSLVAREIEDPLALDLNTAFAALAGTAKHVMVQATDPAHVGPIAEMAYAVAGGEAAFRARPFLSLNINHVVPPLRFHAESIGVIAEAVRLGIPVHCNVFGQLGASSPVTLAGSVAQTLAETLAGLAFVHALDPDAHAIAGPRPMITDLRTGGFSGGSGEQALATSICAQVMRHWGLPCSVIAGATDSKLPDAQAGYEKALNVNTALQAGANMITQAAGMQAGLMGVSFPAMVIDNEMLGTVLRANVPAIVSPDTLALDAIRSVVAGEGHFLGHPDTYARMKSDFLYPDIADRRSVEEWSTDGGAPIEITATRRAREIIAGHWPTHLPPGLAADLQTRFDLQIGPDDLAGPGAGNRQPSG